MSWRSSAVIAILVFGLLFSMLFISQSIVIINPPPIRTKATLDEDDAIHIVKSDIEERAAAPYSSPTSQIEKIIFFDRYPDIYPLRLVYVHSNGAVYYVTSNYTAITGDSALHGYCFKPIDHGCLIRRDNNSTTTNGAEFIESTKGRLAYVIDGAWQLSDMRAADFFYLVDTESGKILWSENGAPVMPE